MCKSCGKTNKQYKFMKYNTLKYSHSNKGIKLIIIINEQNTDVY